MKISWYSAKCRDIFILLLECCYPKEIPRKYRTFLKKNTIEGNKKTLKTLIQCGAFI